MRISTTNAKQKQTPPSTLCRWGAVVFWLFLWQVGAAFWNQPLLLPTPIAVAGRMAVLFGQWSFWQVTLGSLLRILLGFLLGLIVGGLLAVGGNAWRPFRTLVELPIAVIRATPVASFAILVQLFVRGGSFSMLIAFLMVMPISYGNVAAGIASADPQLLEMAKVFRFSPFGRLRAIWIPTLRPHLATAAGMGLGFAWKAGVAAEVIAIPQNAIGTQLYNAKIYLETTDLFAWTVVIILLSVLLERGIRRLLTPAAKSKEAA